MELANGICSDFIFLPLQPLVSDHVYNRNKHKSQPSSPSNKKRLFSADDRCFLFSLAAPAPSSLIRRICLFLSHSTTISPPIYPIYGNSSFFPRPLACRLPWAPNSFFRELPRPLTVCPRRSQGVPKADPETDAALFPPFHAARMPL